MSASIWPSNMGMLKLTCTLKGVALPEWLLEEDVSPLGSRWRIWEKFSIIAFLCAQGIIQARFWKDILPPHLFYLLPLEVVRICKDGLAKVQPVRALTPYTLTSLGYVKKNREGEDRFETTDPSLCRNATEYWYTHKHRNTIEIKLHFINIKELKYAYIHNQNKLARAMVSYL